MKNLIKSGNLRKENPGCGVEKMYYVLKITFIGRNRFIDIFMEIGFRIIKIRKEYLDCWKPKTLKN